MKPVLETTVFLAAVIQWVQAQGTGWWDHHFYVDARHQKPLRIGWHTAHTGRIQIGCGEHRPPTQVGESHFPYDNGHVYIRPRAWSNQIFIGDAFTSRIGIGSPDNVFEVVSHTTTVRALSANSVTVSGQVTARRVAAGDTYMSDGKVCVGQTTCMSSKKICFAGTANCLTEALGELQLNAPRASAKDLRANNVAVGGRVTASTFTVAGTLTADTISTAKKMTAGDRICTGTTCISAGKVCFGKSCMTEDQLATLLILVTERKVQESAKKLSVDL